MWFKVVDEVTNVREMKIQSSCGGSGVHSFLENVWKSLFIIYLSGKQITLEGTLSDPMIVQLQTAANTPSICVVSVINCAESSCSVFISFYFCSILITMVKSCVFGTTHTTINLNLLQSECFIFNGIIHIFFVSMFYENQMNDILLLKQCFCWYLISFLLMLSHHLTTTQGNGFETKYTLATL